MYYIYGIVDPTENMVGYVGITSNTPQRRLVQHLRQDEREGKNTKKQWLNGLLENGYMPTVITLQVVDSIQQAQIAEKWWIAHGQMIGWPLRNSSHYVRPVLLEDDDNEDGDTFVMFDDGEVRFPLPTNRPPTQAEAQALRQLFEQTGSKNAVIRQAYGSKNGVILGYVNQALNGGAA